MSVLSYIFPHIRRLEDEKKELKVELTQAVMRFERRRGEVQQVADDVMSYMQRKDGRNENS